MRLFLLVLVVMRAFGFLTLAMFLHGSAADSALAPDEIPHGHDWKGYGTLVRTEESATKAARIRHSLSSSHPPSSSVYKHYQFGKYKLSSFAHIPTDATHSLSPSSSPAQSPSPLKEPSTPYTIPILPSTVLCLPYTLANTDCSSVVCRDPLTPGPSGSTCGCVLPIDVMLRLNMNTFYFILQYHEFEKQIAASTSLTRSQVKAIEAMTDNQPGDITIVRVHLLPIEKEFNQAMAMSIYLKFWRRQVLVDNKLFGALEVLYVHYPGLPPSPPSALSSNAAVVKGPPNTGTGSTQDNIGDSQLGD